jgi:hypothetical protein
MKLIPRTICLGLLALSALGHTAENLAPYRAPRLPDGHADMQGYGRTPISLRWNGRRESHNGLSLKRTRQSSRHSIWTAQAVPINPMILAGL